MTTRPSLEELARAVRAAVLNQYIPRSCIETTRTLIWCGAQLGVRIDPVPVRVRHSGPFWSVGVTATGEYNPATNGWDGHLVGHLPDAGVLVDASSDQFHRPDKALPVSSPFVVVVARGDLQRGRVWVHNDTGVQSSYQEVQDNGWRLAPAWTDRQHRIEQIGREALAMLKSKRGKEQ